jgi:signal peptidase I
MNSNEQVSGRGFQGASGANRLRGRMKRTAAIATIFAGLFLSACGGGSSGGDMTTYTYPSASMEPTIGSHEEVSADLSAYDHAAPARGDIVAFHPPAGAAVVECGGKHLSTQACPKPTPGLSSQTFIKRIVAIPGDELSIRAGLPTVNGKPAFAQVIRKCSKRELREAVNEPEFCEMPKPITVPPGHYFVMGDNSGESFDSRIWGPIPGTAILARVEQP